MFKALGLKLLFTAVNMLFTKELFEQVYEVVEAASSLEVSGEEKKAKVSKELDDVKVYFKSKFGNVGNSLFNLIVEIALTRLNSALGKI
jgi:hypothetical protein